MYINSKIQLKFLKREGGFKMATKAQKQTEWTPWIKNLAEMLEPLLVEIMHQREPKLWHPELLTPRKLHITLHWENRKVAATASHWLQTCLGDIQQTKQVNTKCHVVFLQSPLGQTTYHPGADWLPPCKRQNWTIHNELKTSTQQRGQKRWKCTWEGERGKELISAGTISKQMARRGIPRW
jgi:hypothetical protein